MQVTHEADHITHAVIGGNKAIEFGISDSAEFFQILSSTLYKDQILAVCRETLCNAWDIHIATGRTHMAVEITLTREKLIIRDFGSGIHDDNMGTVYCVYGGGSTKRNDGRQTGGFSLGCKSPFAYTDHFEVQSFHEGVRTIYALSKSSAERAGKPSLIKIASFPTKEEGLLVTIPIESKDWMRFDQCLTAVARNGSMYVKKDPGNGTKVTIETLNMPVGSEFLITSRGVLDERPPIIVRYGNVCYPITSHADYAMGYVEIVQFLQSLGHHSGSSYQLVLQAPADSISVQPSREGLSMQDRTIKTLSALLEGFIPNMSKPMHDACFDLLDKEIKKVKVSGKIGELLNDNEVLPGRKRDQWGGYMHKTPVVDITSIEKIAEQMFTLSYPNLTNFRATDLDKRMDAALELKYGFTGTMRELRRRLKGIPANELKKRRQRTKWSSRSPGYAHEWYLKRVLHPLAKKLYKAGLSYKKLWVYDVVKGSSESHYVIKPDVYDFHQSFEHYLPMMRNIVVLSHTRTDLQHKIKQAPFWKKMGDSTNFFLYQSPSSAKKILPELRKFFRDNGYQLLDLTEHDPTWMPALPTPEDKALMAKPVPRPKKTGYAALSGAKTAKLAGDGRVYERTWRIDNVTLSDAPRVTKPVAYHFFHASRAEGRDFNLGGNFDAAMGRLIIKLFGDEIAAVYTEPQLTKIKEEEVPTLENFVIPYVIDQITTAPQFLAYWEQSMERVTGSDTAHMIELFDIPEIRTAMGITAVLDERDMTVLFLWREMCSNYRYGDNYPNSPFFKERKVARDLIDKLPKSKIISDLSAKFVENRHLIKALNFGKIAETMALSDKTNNYAQRFADMIKIALT